MPITFQLTSKAPVSDTLVPYQYYIWHITDNKLGAAYLQLAQFQFINADNTIPDMGVTSPVLLDGHATPPYEVVGNLVNGSTSNGNKFLDLNFISGGSRILFSFNEPTAFIGYKWKTANDEPARDPKSWVMYGSNNEEDWDVIHTVTNFISTNDREVFNTPFKYKNIVAPLETKITFTANPPIPPTNDGTTELRAGSSAYQIKTDFPDSADGLYWIQNPNINSGSAFQIYADMTTLGGGWTLLLANSTYVGWTFENSIALNTTTPPSDPTNISQNYSIIGWADYIKKSASNFDYMFDANFRGYNGAAYTALSPYSFIETPQGIITSERGDPFQNTNGWRKNISEIQRFNYNSGTLESPITGSWEYNSETVEFRMPFHTNESAYGPDGNAFITTNGNDGSWWGTLVTGNWDPVAPWMNPVGVGYPTIIWYWVR